MGQGRLDLGVGSSRIELEIQGHAAGHLSVGTSKTGSEYVRPRNTNKPTGTLMGMGLYGQLTCGVAIDVPDIIASTLSPVYHALTMLAPGAKVNTQGPTLLKVARASVLVLAPTTRADGADEGL